MAVSCVVLGRRARFGSSCSRHNVASNITDAARTFLGRSTAVFAWLSFFFFQQLASFAWDVGHICICLKHIFAYVLKHISAYVLKHISAYALKHKLDEISCRRSVHPCLNACLAKKNILESILIHRNCIAVASQPRLNMKI